MSDKIQIRPRARSDVVELAAYIGKENATVADRFLDACEETFGFLSKSPRIGALHRTKNPRLDGLRAFRVRGFANHVTFYLEIPGGIEVIRVVHGARDLGAVFRDE